VDFVTASPRPCPAGKPLEALTDPSDPYHLQSPIKSQGKGDDLIIAALQTLHEYQKEGKILKIGIAGYPLPLLLRLALLAKSQNITIDIVQTYAHQSLQNTSLQDGFLREFVKAGVGIVSNAAPLLMGLLTTSGGPAWHPAIRAQGALWKASREASDICKSKGTSLEVVASDFGYKELKMDNGVEVPVVIGCKNVEEVQRALKSWHKARKGDVDEDLVRECKGAFEKYGVLNRSWEEGAAGPEE
jgi:D-arabinose 1-dehydrogenase